MKKSERLRELGGGLAVLACAASLLRYPAESVAAAGEGLQLCLNVIIPSLFPFFVISTLAIELGMAARLGRLIEPLMRRLFNVSGACAAAFVLGLIGGYPVGARTAIELYERGECSRREAERLLSFCNNSGPAFILGVVGASVFADARVGWLLYFVHGLASVITGLCFRGWRGGSDGRRQLRKNEAAQRPGFAAAFTGSVKSAFASSLNICGFVIFFMVLIKILFASGALSALAKVLAAVFSPFGADSAMVSRLLMGAIELSSGVWSLSDAAAGLSAGAAMAAFMLGWAGVSVHCQTLTFLQSSGLSAKTYIAGKLLHGALSAALTWLAMRMLPFDESAAAYYEVQLSGMAERSFGASLAISVALAAALAGAVIIFSLINAKRLEKRWKI